MPFHEHVKKFFLNVKYYLHFLEIICNGSCDFNPELSVFFDSRMRFDTERKDSSLNETQYYSHWEIESLASGQ